MIEKGKELERTPVKKTEMGVDNKDIGQREAGKYLIVLENVGGVDDESKLVMVDKIEKEGQGSIYGK